MTGAAQAKKLSESILERLRVFFDGQMKPGQIPEFELRGLRRDIDRLSKVDRVEADMADIDLHTWLFDYDRCQELIANIRANGDINAARLGAFRSASNFLHATHALSNVRMVFENPRHEEYHKLIGAAAASGAFNDIALAVELAKKARLGF